MASHPDATPHFLAEHYVYEINMLRATHSLLDTAIDQTLANALIESFAVHARALMDFFGNPGRGDDAVAEHFAAGFQPTAIKSIPRHLRVRLNKQIAHLTYGRVNAQKIGTSDRRILREAIEIEHNAFKQAVEPQFASCFANELQVPASLQQPIVFNIT